TVKIGKTAAGDASKVNVSYSGMTGGGDNYLGVMLVNKATNQKYVGRVAQAAGASGSVDVTLPAGVSMDANYRMFAWLESETNKATSAPVAQNMDLYTPPVVSNVQQNPNAATWANSKTISATVTDNKEGVRRVWYNTSATDPSKTSGEMPLTSGSTYTSDAFIVPSTFYVWAADNAGNTTATGVEIAVEKVDGVPPVISEVMHTTAGTKQRVSARVVDQHTAVSRVFCSTDRNATKTTAGIIEMSNAAGTDIWESAEFAADTAEYYVIAYDARDNRAAAGTRSTGAQIPLSGYIGLTDQNRMVDIDGDGKPDKDVNDLVKPEDIIDVSVPLNVGIMVQYVPGSNAKFYSGVGEVKNNSVLSPIKVEVVEFTKKSVPASTINLVAWGDPTTFVNKNNDIALKLRTPGEMAYGTLYDVFGVTEAVPIVLGTLPKQTGLTFDFTAAFGNELAIAHQGDTGVTEFKNVFKFTKAQITP
ncbi:MAG: hypothetical protein RR234_08970, partial [Christensenella sp.]